MFHVSKEIAVRIERTQAREQAAAAEAWAERHPESGATVEEAAGGLLIFPWADSPLTKAEGLGLEGEVTAEQFDRVEAFFRSRGSKVHVTLSPFADPSLFALLGERGYRIEEMEQVLVRPISAGESFAEPAAGVTVERAEDRELWARVATQGFSDRDEVTDEEVEVGELIANPARAELWIAYVDGEPAGTGIVAFFDGAASLYGTSTRVGYRGRGVQTALLGARLRSAAEAGCDLAIVMTAAGSQSQRNVERAGFRVAYTKVTMIA